MTGRLQALDGLRGLLALYILAGHTAPFLLLPGSLTWLGAFLSHGRAAVELFFVLSGMVILRSLDRAPTRIGAAQFLAMRAGRLIPIYAIALAFAAGTLSLGDPFTTMPWLPASGAAQNIAAATWPQPWFAHLAAHLTMIHGLLPPSLLPEAEYSILGPAWSLSTEWQFYGVVAGILAVMPSKRPARNHWRPIMVCLVLIATSGLLLERLPSDWQPGRAFLPHDAWYFALGVASHGLRLNGPSRAATAWFCLTLFGSCFMEWHQSTLSALGVPVLWIACLLCESPRIPPLIRPLGLLLTAKPLLWVGSLSYPLYLIHAPIQRLLMLWVAPFADQRWASFTFLWGPPAVLLPLAAAYALHRWVEVPCWRWSRAAALGPWRVEPARDHGRISRAASGSNTSAAGRP